MKTKILESLKNKQVIFIFLLLTFISIFTFVYFFQNSKTLLYGDSLSRMNISRKIIDNLNPGVAQVGNVWLPLPQLLMLLLIWNNYLWHTGIAGAVISMISFVLGSIYIYKSAKILTNSFLSSIIALSIYALNINLLYLQTTAMSEPIFLCALSAAIYYFILWVNSVEKYQMHNLIKAALAVSAMTLIRYEALAILFASIPMVFIFTVIKNKKYSKAEGNTFLYGALASLGFIFWTIYLTAIFGDPLFWKNYYTGTHAVGDDKTQLHIIVHHISLFESIWKYFTAVVWMNGLIPTVLSIIGIPILTYKSIKNKSYQFLPIFLSFAIYAFMVLTLQRNTPIDQPVLNIANLLNPETNKFLEFNIRYGILMLPVITLLCAYLMANKFTVIKVLIGAILCVQFFTYYFPVYTLIYQLPISVAGNITQGTPKENAMVVWLKQNYHNDGLIMISALKHDPQMLEMGIDYKNYIHEGAGRYWEESIKDPQRYATWLVFDSYNKDDQVTKYLKDSVALNLYYNQVYENDGMYIYKIKTKPDIILNK